jgi:adenine phosphoribosyltransferase
VSIGAAAATAAAAVRQEDIRERIAEVPDFPEPGVSFKDITPLIEDGEAFRAAVDALADASRDLAGGAGGFDRVLCAEARGFVFGTALAYRAGKGLVLARKSGKLPRRTISASYDLEYGSATLQIHADSVPPGTRVLVVDDLLATGGTARAMCQLVENAGGSVAGVAFLIELAFLRGRDRLTPYPVTSLVSYED